MYIVVMILCCFFFYKGFTVKNKDVEFSKKRPHTAVNGNEESDAEEQYKSTKNRIYYNKKVHMYMYKASKCLHCY